MRFRRPSGRLAKLTLGSVDVAGGETPAEPEIGGHHTLAAARRLAAEVQRLRKMGVDVVADQNSIRQSKPMLFGEAVVDFVKTYAKKRQRRWRDTARVLGLKAEDGGLLAIRSGLADEWRDRPITDISGRDIADALKATVDRGAAYAANSQLAALRHLFNWLAERHLVDSNPCSRIKRPTPVESRDRVLTDGELRRVWTAAGDLGHPWSTLLHLLILTGQRLNEVARMEWSELNEDLSLWTIPKERTKNKRQHVVPLPPLAREMIASVPRIEGCRFVLSTNGETPVSGFSKVKKRLDQALAEGSEGSLPVWRNHDLRRTAATGMARFGSALPVIERVLNHVSGSFGGIVGVYQRHEFTEEKREAIERWADFVVSTVAGKEDLAGGPHARNEKTVEQRGKGPG